MKEKPTWRDIYLSLGTKEGKRYTRLGKKQQNEDINKVENKRSNAILSIQGGGVIAGLGLAYLFKEPLFALGGPVASSGLAMLVDDMCYSWKIRKIEAHNPAFYYSYRSHNSLDKTLNNQF